jgi:hypothetical protein
MRSNYLEEYSEIEKDIGCSEIKANVTSVINIMEGAPGGI